MGACPGADLALHLLRIGIAIEGTVARLNPRRGKEPAVNAAVRR
jgi:hypothetical protein